MKLTKWKSAALALMAAGLCSGLAQDYTVLARTLTAPGGTVTDRLFLNVGNPTAGNEVPIGSIVWFVADTSGNGVPTSPLEGSILGADDFLIGQDTVDGAIIGSNIGAYQRTFNSTANFNIPGTTRAASIVMYVWDAVGSIQAQPTQTASYVPAAGAKFGIYNLGNVSEAPAGDTNWDIVGNVFAREFTVAAVPEPSTYLLSGLGILGLALYRRINK